MEITFGADPELFIIDTTTKKVVSSIGLIPGKKGEPWVKEGWEPGFGLETDNILAEFNIPASTSFNAFCNNILFMQDEIRKFVQEVNPNYDILCAASQVVDSSQLQSKEAKLFGCDPDYNAYTMSVNPKPKGNRTNVRSAGFHIHCGYDNPNIDQSLYYIKRMDVLLGIPSVVIDPDTKRRSLYGKAGAFRLTDYGLEYRVLSSAMMENRKKLELICQQLEKVFDDEYELDINPDVVQHIINTSDVKEANKVIEDLNLL